MASLIQNEIAKFINASNPNLMNMVNLLDSAGTNSHFILNVFNSLCKDSWILDSEASNYIYENANLFKKLHDLENPAQLYYQMELICWLQK